MFAVPGWSVSADALRPQTEEKIFKSSDRNGTQTQNSTNKKSRKRKRGQGANKGVEVTVENLGELWKRHIEQNDLDGPIRNGKNFGGKAHSKNKMKSGGVSDGVHDLEDGVSEAFEEDNNDVNIPDQEESITKTKRRKRESKKKEFEANDEANSYDKTAEGPTGPLEKQALVEGGKSKYEKRKAKATSKREQKAVLQANGTLSPTRPECTPVHPNVLARSKAHKPPNTMYTSTLGISSETTLPSKISEVVEPQNHHQLPKPSDPLSTSAKLTPLQQRMAAKLTSARFRHLNQTLYTSHSDQAMRLFSDSPQAYTSYHAGFRAQVAVWPQNPVEGFVEDIRARGSVSIPTQKKVWRDQKKGKKPKGIIAGDVSVNGNSVRGRESLPRSNYSTCTIADLGCGDATLASSLLPSRKSLNLNILSFDLAKGDTPNANLVTVADISNLSTIGISEGSVDVAICCLSLMGTNWVDVVDECARVVRAGGEVWVAEIKSRFARPGQVKGKKGNSIGQEKRRMKSGESKDEDEDEEPPNLIEVEEEDFGTHNTKEETNVSAFVHVFAKRGFNLKGEPDMSNKMFVKMRFVMGFSRPIETKTGGDWSRVEDGWKGKPKRRFLDEEEDGEVHEGRVLKPCVYKTR